MDAKVYSYGVRGLVKQILDRVGRVEAFRQLHLTSGKKTLGILYADKEAPIVTFAVVPGLTLEVLDVKGQRIFLYPNTFSNS